MGGELMRSAVIVGVVRTGTGKGKLGGALSNVHSARAGSSIATKDVQPSTTI